MIVCFAHSTCVSPVIRDGEVAHFTILRTTLLVHMGAAFRERPGMQSTMAYDKDTPELSCTLHGKDTSAFSTAFYWGQKASLIGGAVVFGRKRPSLCSISDIDLYY
jgi:hypothetical protein